MPNGHIFVPSSMGKHLVKEYHQPTHLGKTAPEALLKKNSISQLPALCQAVREQCVTCAKNNARSAPRPPPGPQRMGAAPFEDLEVDFTDIQSNKGFRYLLVIICTYLGWVKAFLTRRERSCEVAKVLLWEIVPRFGLPLTIHSDKGPAFVADIIQTLTKSLNITWKLHIAYRPQSSGKVEQMNCIPRKPWLSSTRD